MGVARFDGKKWGYSGLFNPEGDSDFGFHYYREYADGELTDTAMLSSFGFKKPPVIGEGYLFGNHYYDGYADGVLTDSAMNEGVEFDTPVIE